MRRGGRLAPVSAKRAAENRERAITRRVVMARCGGRCEAAALIARVDPVAASECQGRAVDLHEVKKRSRGGSITDPANCLGVCRRCHDWTESEVALATEVGLLIPSWATP